MLRTRTILSLCASVLAGCALIEASVLDKAVGSDAGGEAGLDATLDGVGTDAADAMPVKDAGDAAPVCQPPDGGLPCDPGFVDCPKTQFRCEQASNLYCCNSNFMYTCLPTKDAGLNPCFGGSTFRCDEDGDCLPGERCWGTITNSTLSTFCSSTQPVGTAFRVCKSLSECSSCVVQSCMLGNTPMLVESCGGTGNMYCK